MSSFACNSTFVFSISLFTLLIVWSKWLLATSVLGKTIEGFRVRFQEMLHLGYQFKVLQKLINPCGIIMSWWHFNKNDLCYWYLASLSFKLFSFKAIFPLHLKSLVGICNNFWNNDDEVPVVTTKTWLSRSFLWHFVGFEMFLSFVLRSKKIGCS